MMVKARLLRETIPGTRVDMASPEEPSVTGGSWEIGSVTIGTTPHTVIFASGYFDLSGYSIDQLTTFIQGTTIQETPLLNGFGTFFAAHIVSTEPLDISDFEISSTSTSWALPGSLSSSYTLQQIIVGQCAYWATDSTVNTVRHVGQGSWGVGSSTADQKLYYAVAYAFPTAAPAQVFIPDTSFIVSAMVQKEKDLNYIMRLKRSIESV